MNNITIHTYLLRERGKPRRLRGEEEKRLSGKTPRFKLTKIFMTPQRRIKVNPVTARERNRVRLMCIKTKKQKRLEKKRKKYGVAIFFLPFRSRFYASFVVFIIRLVFFSSL